MTPEVATAIEDIKQISGRLLRDFEKVPEERLRWSPSTTARTPLAIMAHCGFSLGFITELLGGKPYPAPTMAQADEEFLEMEKGITTRDQALNMWQANMEKHIGLLESLAERDMDKLMDLPFGMTPAPLRYIVGVGSIHTREHVAQLEYVQTIYGDREW